MAIGSILEDIHRLDPALRDCTVGVLLESETGYHQQQRGGDQDHGHRRETIRPEQCDHVQLRQAAVLPQGTSLHQLREEKEGESLQEEMLLSTTLLMDWYFLTYTLDAVYSRQEHSGVSGVPDSKYKYIYTLIIIA